MTKIPAFGRARNRIRPRVPRAPVNRVMILASACGTLSWMSWPGFHGDGLQLGFSALGAILSASLSAAAFKNLKADYRKRYGVAVSEMASDDHGSARQSTPEERAARGMSDGRYGGLFGLDDHGHAVWRPEKAFMALITMPPGGGKTSSFVMGSILHYAILGHSLLVPDVKADIAPMLVRILRQLGKEVWCINPVNLHLQRTGNTIIGLYQPIIDAFYGDEQQQKTVTKLAADYAALHHPMTGDEKNPYFGQGSRRVIALAILICCYIDPSNCTPTAVYILVTDPAAFLALCRKAQSFKDVRGSTAILDDIKREARNLLHRASKNEENFASFLEGASQKFLSFSVSGMLGNYGAGAIHSLSAMRDRQIIVFIMTPLSAIREFADKISLINHGVVAAVKAKPDGHPLHIVGEEALNYRFGDLVSDLEMLRQYGVTIDLYIQSQAGLERHYGRTAAAAINAYADIRIYGALNDFSEAKQVSAMLSEATVQRQEISYQDAVTELGIARREIGRPLMKPNEVLAMPKNQVWMFVNGLHPVRLTTLSYAQVSPWRDWVDPSPITGTRLEAKSVLTVHYDLKGGDDA